MSTTELQLDEFLNTSVVEDFDTSGLDGEPTEIFDGIHWQEPGYTGSIDYRIRQLSYSSRLTLHSCPRKFELYKRKSTKRAEISAQKSITFAFGHCVGEAIQLALQGFSYQEVVWKIFLAWKPGLLDADEKRKKSFWEALIAIQKFYAAREAGFLSDYELVYYDGKPACELSFCITLLNGFRYRGFVDAVLRHKETNKIIVLEGKTTSAKYLHPAMYKNSSQAVGYSIVLDSIFPDLSSYDILYLPYMTLYGEYRPMEFTKLNSERANWIQELVTDVEEIERYEAVGHYPMHGESCFNFSEQCEFYDVCTLSTDYLTKPCTSEEKDKIEYQINLSILDLVNTQMENVV
jgi:hypothetical protein